MCSKHQLTFPPEKLSIVSLQEELAHYSVKVLTPLLSSFSLPEKHHYQSRDLLPTLCNNFSETTYKEYLQYHTLKDSLRKLILTVKVSLGVSVVAPIEMYLLDYYLEIGSQSQTQIIVSINSYLFCKSQKQVQEKTEGEGHPILIHRHPRSGFVKKEKKPNISVLFLPEKQIQTSILPGYFYFPQVLGLVWFVFYWCFESLNHLSPTLKPSTQTDPSSSGKYSTQLSQKRKMIQSAAICIP